MFYYIKKLIFALKIASNWKNITSELSEYHVEISK